MPYDGLITRTIKNELYNLILLGKIDKIHQPSKDEIIIHIRNNRINYKLLLSSNASNCRTHLTNYDKANPTRPFNFCMVLRKYLLGAKLLNISQFSNDRILEFNFENINELGDKESKTLVIEMMGKHSNIILLNNNRNIIDSIKHVDFEMSSVREVMPGRPYEYPPIHDKVNPFEADKELAENNYIGISTLGFNEIRNIGLSNFINTTPTPCIIYQDEKLIDFYVIQPTTLENTAMKSFDTMSEAIDEYYNTKLNLATLNSYKAELSQLISKQLNKTQKKLKIAQNKIKEASNLEDYKIKGELISANIYRIKPNQETTILENFYDEYKPIELKLNPYITPAQNAQAYFKKYNKLKNTISACTLQEEELSNEIKYLESILFSIDTANSREDLNLVKEDLVSSGYIKESKKKEKETTSSYLTFNYMGFEILVGRNNIQNDMLTFKVAMKNDIWLHAKNIPGSHTIIKTQNKEVPDEVLEYAASLAALYSKAKTSPKVEIDYTKAVYVKKIHGAKPGMVTYTNFKTVYIEPYKL